MNKEISELELRVGEHCDLQQRYDEDLFNMGVELGRLLQSQNISEFRPACFIEFDKQYSEFLSLADPIKNINGIFEVIVCNAIASQIEKTGEFIFAYKNREYQTTKFDDEVVEKFQIQIDSTTQEYSGAHIQITLKIVGALAEAFEKRGVRPVLQADVDCDTGENYEIMTTPELVRKINWVETALDARDKKMTKEILADIAAEIEPVYAWLLLSIKTVR